MYFFFSFIFCCHSDFKTHDPQIPSHFLINVVTCVNRLMQCICTLYMFPIDDFFTDVLKI